VVEKATDKKARGQGLFFAWLIRYTHAAKLRRRGSRSISAAKKRNLHAGKRHYSDPRLDASLEQCLADLRITDPRDDKSRIESTKGGLLEDSYRWILDHQDFRQWYSNDNQLLWIRGDPGKGKTMLLCGIVNELVNELNSLQPNHRLISYFLCQATDANLNNATAVLRGLIYTILRQDRSLIKHVHEEWKFAGKGLFEDANAWNALLRIFAILQNYSSSEHIFIVDALDECSKADLHKLLPFITEQSLTGRAKWIISSRNWPEIEEHLQTTNQKVQLSLELNAQLISAAVHKYIQYKVDGLKKMKGFNQAKRNEITE
jgi:archaellum biogenesis ATPase FlaH